MQYTRILAFSCIMLTGINAFAQDSKGGDPNIIEKGVNSVKLFDADQDFLRGEIKKALTTYNNVLKEAPNDGKVMYKIGLCHLRLNNIENAVEYFEKAQKHVEKPFEELYLNSGEAYHKNGDVEKAIKAYEDYIVTIKAGKYENGILIPINKHGFLRIFPNKASKKREESNVDLMLTQVKMAKNLMEKPVAIEISNMDAMNSAEDDKNPSISADGKILIFSSRRPTKGTNSSIDKGSDFGYYEDIYAANWDESKKQWGPCQLLPGSINVEDEHEACCSITPDGKKIYVYKNSLTKGRGGDIYISKVNSQGKWSKPESLGIPVNSSYYEDGAVLSPDGNTLYFISEFPRKGAQGQADIWYCKKKSKTEWDKPINMGADINTPFDEVGLCIAPDGKTLFFSSNGHSGMGGFDVFRTTFENGKWTKPVNLGYPINSVNNDMKFSLSADAKVAYLGSDRKGGMGGRDIYKIDLKDYAVLEKDFSKTSTVLSILRGDVFDSQAGQAMIADITILDESGKEVVGTTVSDEGGNYFITLTGGKKYMVKVEAKGYKTVTETFDLKADKQNTFTLVKHYILTKEK